MAQNDAIKAAGGNSPGKAVTTPPLGPIYNQATHQAGQSSIENDRKNLNQAVFGISLKSHWVFKGSAATNGPQRNDAQAQLMNATQTSLLGGGSVLTP
jgi:hypothetical protein